jgi:hypothetical protein
VFLLANELPQREMVLVFFQKSFCFLLTNELPQSEVVLEKRLFLLANELPQRAHTDKEAQFHENTFCR